MDGKAPALASPNGSSENPEGHEPNEPTSIEDNAAPAAAPSTKKMNKPRKSRSRTSKRRATRKKPAKAVTAKKGPKSFPAETFEEALILPLAIQKIGGGFDKVRRLTLFESMNRSPDSSATRRLIYTSSRYGLTRGSHTADFIELTDDGRVASSSESSAAEQFLARFRLAIERIAPFNSLYQAFQGRKMPALELLRDHLLDEGYAADEVAECVDSFIVNAKYIGVLKTMGGVERLVTKDHALEGLAVDGESVSSSSTTGSGGSVSSDGQREWNRICFYITPIGEEGSEQRKHSDLFLGNVVEPAVEEFDLTVVRADKIGKPGMISPQVIEFVMRSRLVIADLSFINPNVFYELALRHASRLPTVQIIRSADVIPFDIDQFRTIRIDTTDIYSLVPQLVTYRSEISSQVRRALGDPESVDNPLTVFYPQFWKQVAVNSTA